MDNSNQSFTQSSEQSNSIKEKTILGSTRMRLLILTIVGIALIALLSIILLITSSKGILLNINPAIEPVSYTSYVVTDQVKADPYKDWYIYSDDINGITFKYPNTYQVCTDCQIIEPANDNVFTIGKLVNISNSKEGLSIYIDQNITSLEFEQYLQNEIKKLPDQNGTTSGVEINGISGKKLEGYTSGGEIFYYIPMSLHKIIIFSETQGFEEVFQKLVSTIKLTDSIYGSDWVNEQFKDNNLLLWQFEHPKNWTTNSAGIHEGSIEGLGQEDTHGYRIVFSYPVVGTFSNIDEWIQSDNKDLPENLKNNVKITNLDRDSYTVRKVFTYNLLSPGNYFNVYKVYIWKKGDKNWRLITLYPNDMEWSADQMNKVINRYFQGLSLDI